VVVDVARAAGAEELVVLVVGVGGGTAGAGFGEAVSDRVVGPADVGGAAAAGAKANAGEPVAVVVAVGSGVGAGRACRTSTKRGTRSASTYCCGRSPPTGATPPTSARSSRAPCASVSTSTTAPDRAGDRSSSRQRRCCAGTGGSGARRWTYVAGRRFTFRYAWRLRVASVHVLPNRC
jgi:hypothetical protein